jgi:hypothetical protein
MAMMVLQRASHHREAVPWRRRLTGTIHYLVWILAKRQVRPEGET